MRNSPYPTIHAAKARLPGPVLAPSSRNSPDPCLKSSVLSTAVSSLSALEFHSSASAVKSSTDYHLHLSIARKVLYVCRLHSSIFVKCNSTLCEALFAQHSVYTLLFLHPSSTLLLLLRTVLLSTTCTAQPLWAMFCIFVYCIAVHLSIATLHSAKHSLHSTVSIPYVVC